MGIEGEKTPDPTPPKDVIYTPPKIPSLPGNLTAGLNDEPASTVDMKAKPVDFRAAVANAMATDESPVMKPLRHERGVSWDQNVADNSKMPISPLPPAQNPADQQALSFMARTVGKPGMPPRPPAVAKRVISGNSVGYSRRTLNLESIADDPFEKEAEDVILQSLEERDPMHVRSNTGANILAGVPDEIAHNFSLDSVDGGGSQAPPGTRPSLNRPRLASNDYSKASRTSQRPKIFQQPTHKRQLTVEEALFGLTAALSAVHADEVDQGILPSHGSPKHERNDTANSTDRLAKTAELIFGKTRFMKNRASFASDGGASTSGDDLSSPKQDGHRQQPSTRSNLTSSVTSGVGGGGGAKSKWGLLKANMGNLDGYKKTDIAEEDEQGEGLEGIDIETGKDDEDHDKGHKNSTDEETGSADEGGQKKKKKKRLLQKALGPFKHLPYADKIKNEWDLFNSFMAPRKTTMFTYARYIILYIWIPALTAAAILYHFFKNPPTGKGPWPEDIEQELAANATMPQSEPVEKLENKASISWWIIFIALRQVAIVVIAKCVEAVVVDFLAIQTRAILRSFGPVITLLFVQSKGWPFLLSCWGILNFLLVTGDTRFNHHWLFWQDLWGLFNDNNPSGDVTNTLWFTRICAIATGLGIFVSAKRVAIGIYLGRQTFANYSDKLAKIMNSMLQVSQVAILAQAIEKKYYAELDKFHESGYHTQQSTRNFSRDNLMSLIATANEENTDDISMMDLTSKSANTAEGMDRVIDPDDVDPFTGNLGESQRSRIADLLGRWEEPGRGPLKSDNISVGAVLQFRRALASMDTPYPFSGSFGLADTREHCVASAQAVYERLKLKNRLINGKLHFDTMAVLALQRDGQLDQERAKELIRTFRPDRDGGISMVDFVRSVDAVYKELRMLRATVAASSKIDKALESIMNIVFYIAVSCAILAVYGFDPLALFLSLSSVILAFAFMIGSASAKYFEGLLLILIQRPYGIGDRINVSNPESVTSWTGAQGWIVDDVTLFTTTFYMVGTNEMATVSNGALAKSRIINGARSKRAILLLNLKFGLEVPYNRIEVFKSAVEKFVKARPREWLGLLGIRAGRVEADLGFVEYTVVLQHRESWQNAGPVLDSKHSVHCFMLELTKKLDLRYKSPPLPVLLQYGQSGPVPTIDARFVDDAPSNGNSIGPNVENDAPLSPRSFGTNASDDVQAVMHMFDAK